MSELTTNVNWIAVGAGTLVSFLLGWLWYSPILFGKKWAEGNNVELATKDSPMPVFPLVVQLVATFLLAWLIGVTASNNALLTAILILVTIAMIVAANGLFAKKSRYAIWVESIFIIVMGVVMIGMNGIL